METLIAKDSPHVHLVINHRYIFNVQIEREIDTLFGCSETQWLFLHSISLSLSLSLSLSYNMSELPACIK